MAPKVYLLCGKICSGKTVHADELRKKYGAVVLSVDEITLALFGQDAGDRLDDYVTKTKTCLFRKSLEIIGSGISVILDWGFWTKEERAYAKRFYQSRNIPCELHYIDIDDQEWLRRMQKRNDAVRRHETDAYYVDEGLAAKFEAVFEPPEPEEIDIRIH